MAAALIFSAGALIAGALLAWRIFVYLRDGNWIVSLCGTTTVANQATGFHFPDACQPLQTGWVGVDRIIRWFQYEADASLSIGIIAGVFLLITMILVAIAASIDQDMSFDS